MTINFLTSIFIYLTISIILYPSVISATSCSMFSSLNCSCYQSNSDIDLSPTKATYSHLFCQGTSLNEKTFMPPFGNNFYYQNRFRTISLEFFFQNENIEVQSNQFNALALLFLQTVNNAQIQISLRFNNFGRIKFNNGSINSNLFQRKHQNRRLSLYLFPTMFHISEIEFPDENSTDIDEQIKFEENSLSGLSVSEFSIYTQTRRDQYSLSVPFESIFNNTNIGELHFHDSIIPPGSFYAKETFKGAIQSLTIHRRVDTLDSNTFPYYSPVSSYNIHSIEPHEINLYSLSAYYDNLRGIEITKPRFEVSIDTFIPSLESLTLDVEYLDSRTFYAAQHINNLKLGSRLRRIDPYAFHSFPQRLKHLDLLDVDLSQMTSDARCHLIHYIYHTYKYGMKITFPHVENLTECDCARLIILDIQSMKNSKIYANNDLSCSKQCPFSDCFTISEYYKEKDPLFKANDESLNTVNKTDDSLPSIDLFPDTHDVNMMNFLFNQQVTTSSRQTTRMFPVVIEDFDDSRAPSETVNLNPVEQSQDDLSKSKHDAEISWLFLLIGGLVLLFIIILLTVVISLVIRHRRQRNFIRVPVYI